jgi:hypothetical protein
MSNLLILAAIAYLQIGANEMDATTESVATNNTTLSLLQVRKFTKSLLLFK